MVRCDAFYGKIQKLWELGQEEVDAFCNKDPETVRRIETHLDIILPWVGELISKSEILSEEKPPIGGILSEGASRPLISEKDPNVRKEAMQHIVTLAEEKVMDGKKPQVTSREVAEILAEVKGTLAQEPGDKPLACSLEACPLDGAQEKEEHPEPESVKPTPDQVEMVQDWEAKRAKDKRPGIPKVLTDVVDYKEIRNFVKDTPCPWCKKRSVLVWQCCGHTVEESLVVATRNADAHMKRFGDGLQACAMTYEQYREDERQMALREKELWNAKQEEQQL